MKDTRKTLFICYGLIAAAVISILILEAADITPGETFGSGDTITAAKLNNAHAGTINSTFFTGKSSGASPTAGNTTMLYYDTGSSAFKRWTLANLLDHTGWVTDRTSSEGIEGTDEILISDAGTYKKATVDDLVLTNLALISTRTEISDPVASGDELLIWDDSANAYYKVSQSDLMTNSQVGLNIGSLTFNANPNGLDYFFLTDIGTGENTYAFLSTLVNGQDAKAAPISTDELLIYDSASVLTKKITFAAAKTYATNEVHAFEDYFSWTSTTNLQTVIATAADAVEVAHGWSVVPRLIEPVLVCSTVDIAGDHGVDDEVPLSDVWSFNNTSGVNYHSWGMTRNATNIHVTFSLSQLAGSFGIYVMRKDGSAQYAIDYNDWKLRLRAWK